MEAMKVQTDLVRMRVLVGDRPIHEYHKEGKTYVEGKKGALFKLEVENLTWRRILVHPAVDGISVMTGKTASRRDNHNGYVLGPRERLVIPGWRLDDEEVAHFFFADDDASPEDRKSYAERTGRGENKGVIACPVWEEKQPDWTIRCCSTTAPTFEMRPTSREVVSSCYTHTDIEEDFAAEGPPIAVPAAGPAPEAGAAYESETTMDWMEERPCPKPQKKSKKRKAKKEVKTQNLGAGFGKKQQHVVQEVTFKAATSEPVAVAMIFYDDRKGLRARGIRLSAKKRKPDHPNPFPADKGCTPPAGWSG